MVLSQLPEDFQVRSANDRIHTAGMPVHQCYYANRQWNLDRKTFSFLSWYLVTLTRVVIPEKKIYQYLRTEWFVYWKIRFDDEHRCTSNLHFFEDVTTTSIQHTVDTTYGYLRTLNFTQVNWFHQTRSGRDRARIQTTTRGWNNLSTTSVDSVSV